MDYDAYFHNLKNSKRTELDDLRSTFVDHLERLNGQVGEMSRQAAIKNFDAIKVETEQKYITAFQLFEDVLKRRDVPNRARTDALEEAKKQLEASLRTPKRVLYNYMVEFMK